MLHKSVPIDPRKADLFQACQLDQDQGSRAGREKVAMKGSRKDHSIFWRLHKSLLSFVENSDSCRVILQKKFGVYFFFFNFLGCVKVEHP